MRGWFLYYTDRLVSVIYFEREREREWGEGGGSTYGQMSTFVPSCDSSVDRYLFIFILFDTYAVFYNLKYKLKR